MTAENNPLHAEREQMLDWLTALLPVWLISVFYYRWWAVALELLAVGGYLMGAVLLSRLVSGMPRVSAARGLVLGVLLAFCLPAGVPFWVAALGGGAVAVVDMFTRFGKEKHPDRPLPVLQPAMAAFLLLRLAVPAVSAEYPLPAQWTGIDSLAAATPLLALNGQPLCVEHWQLWFGVYGGTIGEGCTAAILLMALYLLLRRRIRLIAPACMLVTVAGLSLWLWRSPLYALLTGGVALTAVLLADKSYLPAHPGYQAAEGVVAGAVTVFVRKCTVWTEGAAVGLLTAQVLLPFLPYGWHFLQYLWKKLRHFEIFLRKNENNS